MTSLGVDALVGQDAISHNDRKHILTFACVASKHADTTPTIQVISVALLQNFLCQLIIGEMANLAG